jgi:hypothetical protein
VSIADVLIAVRGVRRSRSTDDRESTAGVVDALLRDLEASSASVAEGCSLAQVLEEIPSPRGER